MKKASLLIAAMLSAHSPELLAAPPAPNIEAPIGTEQTMIASSADPRASEAGAEILRKGGSASDAAMAMMLALTVVEPQSSGIGGGGFLVHHSGDNGRLSTINGRETAPASAKADRFIGPDGRPLGFADAFQGGHSVGVPGNIRLMAMAHAKWGRLPWADLFQPAIRLAEDGFVVNKTLESRLAMVETLWPRFPKAQALYWRDGKPVKAGTLIRNPDIGKSLRSISMQGPDAFYTGDIAKDIVETVTASPVNPGDITLDDMSAYKAKEQSAVCAPYRIVIVCGMGPPSSGATTVLQILGTLERFDLSALGKDNPKSWHLIAEAMKLAYADRESYLADDAFVSVPVEAMLARPYLDSRAALISPNTARGNYPAGDPVGAEKRTPAISGEVAGTTHFTAVDAAGNIANMTSTIEGPFGSQLIAGGFFLNNELTDFSLSPQKDGAPVANRVEGGKRPLSSMSPTMVFDRDGKPLFALGSAGGKRIIMHVTKTIIGKVDFGLSLKDAIALPNIYFKGTATQLEAGTPLADMAGNLSAYGVEAKPADLGSKVNGAEWTVRGWIGAADLRSEGSAITMDADGKIIARDGATTEVIPAVSVY